MKIKMKVRCDHSIELSREDEKKRGRASIEVKLLPDVEYDLPDEEAEKLIGFGYAEQLQ